MTAFQAWHHRPGKSETAGIHPVNSFAVRQTIDRRSIPSEWLKPTLSGRLARTPAYPRVAQPPNSGPSDPEVRARDGEKRAGCIPGICGAKGIGGDSLDVL